MKFLKYINILALLVPFAVNAASTLVNDTQEQTLTGQDFSFDFTALPLSDGGTGLLTVKLRGDFTLDEPEETFGYDIDGITSAAGFGATAGNLLSSTTNHDNLFELSFTISALDLANILSDGDVSITIDYSDFVHNRSRHDTATVTLKYESGAPKPDSFVPEPASLALLGLGGIAGIGFSRKKSKVS